MAEFRSVRLSSSPFEQEQDGLGQANTLQSLGDLLRVAGALNDALGTYEAALALYERAQDSNGAAYTLAEIARCLSGLNENARRDQAVVAALRVARGSGYENVLGYVLHATTEAMGSKEKLEALLAMQTNAQPDPPLGEFAPSSPT